jgi:hypothetical protein
MGRIAASKKCSVCEQVVGEAHLQFRQVEDRARFCSFECMITFAVYRIRQRREHHNQQLQELRETVKKLRRRQKA